MITVTGFEWRDPALPTADAKGEAGERTARALAESEGATERAELAAGQCTNTWRNYPHENLRGDINIYRQHRCGREGTHRGVCRCRYCGRDRGNA